jgi:hypothetical protein
MLISDEIKIPYESVGDWTALLLSWVVYVTWCVLTYVGCRRFAKRTGMSVLTAVFAVLLFASGLIPYALVFLKLDAFAHRLLVQAALPAPLTPRSAELLTNLVSERALAFIKSPWGEGARGLVFLASPLVAVAVSVLATRSRRSMAIG